MSFSYDGFGNRLSQTVTKGSGPASSLAISLANNRITTSGYGYDSNGNLTTRPSETLTYDNDNRLVQASGGYGTEKYSYTPLNQRVYRKLANGTEEYYFYGVTGERLGTYVYGPKLTSMNLYFAGRLIQQKMTDAAGVLRGHGGGAGQARRRADAVQQDRRASDRQMSSSHLATTPMAKRSPPQPTTATSSPPTLAIPPPASITP